MKIHFQLCPCMYMYVSHFGFFTNTENAEHVLLHCDLVLPLLPPEEVIPSTGTVSPPLTQTQRLSNFSQKNVECSTYNGYRQGKCFSKSGWQQLVSMFNTEAGKDWNRVQLKNHWFSMRREYQLLHELLRCTGIEYDHQTNIIVADDWWWERKIQGNKEFEKFRGRDCGQIFHKYSQLFGDAYDSEKYAVSPTKLSKKGFDDDEVWEQVGHTDKLPVNAEMHDEHAPSEFQGCGSPMDTSVLHSGDKRKCSYGSAKGKKKLSSHAALSESVEKLGKCWQRFDRCTFASKFWPSLDR
ncbi:Myb/SANT-like DNA-binding domain protein [Abeliophyllum distichum]|uniref:Myb/SANT-like DNA-binding domain protein n=1 Tax=Abeliophyllum distichum TaxID=126358 RepID=A0ABD1PNH0_9LAMI